MEIKEKLIGRVSVLSLIGRLDSPYAYTFLKLLKKKINSGTTRIVIDFSDVTSVSSVGLGVLVSSHRLAREKEGGVKVVNLSEDIKASFETTGIHIRFPFYRSLNEALESFDDTAQPEQLQTP